MKKETSKKADDGEKKDISPLQKALDSIRDKYGEGAVMTSESITQSVDFTPSGSFLVDDMLGGGLPKGRIMEIYGENGCQPAGSKVLMSDGTWKNIEDLKLGDTVISPQRDGTNLAAKVLHLYDWASPRNFSIRNRTTGDEFYKCSFNHVVPFIGSFAQRKDGVRDEKVTVTTVFERTAAEVSSGTHGIESRAVFSCPRIEDFGKERNVPAPYSLGMMLANGSLHAKGKGQVTLSSNLRLSCAITERMKREGVIFTAENIVYKGANKENVTTSRLKRDQPFLDWLSEQGLLESRAHKKFIPHEALFSNAKCRERILAGLIEGDGSLIPPSDGTRNPQWDYATVSQQLAEDISFLVHSLGGKATITGRNTRCQTGTFFSYRIYISLPHKLEMANTKKEGNGNGHAGGNVYFPMRYPMEAVEVGRSRVYGMALSSPSQWYVTDNWIVTHNSGKTVMSLFFAAQIQKNGGTVAYIDAEHAFNREFAEKIGVDVSKLLVSQTGTLEEAFDIMRSYIESESVNLVILDSTAALLPKKVIEYDEMLKEDMGLVARLLSRGLQIIIGPAAKSKTTIIFINQTRENLGVTWGDKTTTPGGKALKFYSSVRVQVKRGEKMLDSKDVHVGNVLKLNVVKNKVGMPFKTCEVNLSFLTGIDKTKDMFDFAVKIGVITVDGKTYTFKNKKLGIGEPASVKFISNNQEVFDLIEAEIRGKQQEASV
jgi:recombination protein RecA